MQTPAIVEFHNKVKRAQISKENKSMLLSKMSIEDARQSIINSLECEYDIELDYAYSLLPGQQFTTTTSNGINMN